ncbi:MAG: HDIG domain-containing metalloprotein [Candidatus Paceibacterota bacterium]
MTDLPLSREEALKLLKSYPQTTQDMNHYFESEAVMRELASEMGEDVEYWGMLGLLHDVDWAITKEDPSEHLSKAPEILESQGFDKKFIDTVVSHGYGAEVIPDLKGKERDKNIEKALAASESITGLVHAYALMRDKRVSDMEVKGLKKKFKDVSFAAGCNRQNIKEIEDLGLDLNDFFALAITAFGRIKEDIGLR